MKFSVYLKVLAAFAIITCIFIVSFFKYMKSVELNIVANSEKVIAKGLLSSLAHELSHTPKTQWFRLLDKQKGTIEVHADSTMHFDKSQQSALDKGEVLVLTGDRYQFLNLVLAKKTAFKKIENASYIISYEYDRPESIVSHYMNPILKQIKSTLQKEPEHKWPTTLKQLQTVYDLPLSLHEMEGLTLPLKIHNALSHQQLVFDTNPNSSQISIIYYKFNHHILKLGPIHYSALTTRISDVIGYFVILFFLFALLLISLFSRLFIRNIKKIYRITERFSQGNFHMIEKVAPTSVLYGLYENIIQMGKRLQDLIESHKQMCRFIAHEIRTPLSTIQMATDSIKYTHKNDKPLAKEVNSIQEDIENMNDIVSTFLIYSKIHATEFKIKKEKVDIIPWLNELLKPFQASSINVTSNYNGLFKAYTEIDKSIFKQAVTNLITNAMKFAENEIRITLEKDNEHLFIHVDDDGAGLPNDGIDDIFTEYVTNENTDIDNKHIGLGLAIVQKIIALHKGQIVAKPSPILKGARFYIVISIAK